MSEMMTFKAIISAGTPLFPFVEFQFLANSDPKVGDTLRRTYGFTTYHFRVTGVNLSAKTVNVTSVHSVGPR